MAKPFIVAVEWIDVLPDHLSLTSNLEQPAGHVFAYKSGSVGEPLGTADESTEELPARFLLYSNWIPPLRVSISITRELGVGAVRVSQPLSKMSILPFSSKVGSC